MKQYSILVLLLLAIVSCKKEVKYVIPNYKLEIVSGNNINDYNGRYSTTPVVVKITQAGNTIQLYNTNFTFEFESTNCDFNAMGAVKPKVKVVTSTDGNLLLYWYTGEKTGILPVTFWLVDADTKNRISSVTIKANIAQNPDGFIPSCMNSPGSILHLEDEKYMLFGHEIYITNNSGLTWDRVSSQVPTGDYLSYNFTNIKPFNFYHKQSGSIFYTNNSTIFQSLDFGLTWQFVTNTKGYIGQISPDDFLVNDIDLGVKKLHINSNGEASTTYWSIIPNASGLVIDPSNKLYINTTIGQVYTSNSFTDSNLVNQNSSARYDFLYREGNTIYVFSEESIYQLNNGILVFLGSTPIPQNHKVVDVLKQNNTYYVLSCNERYWGENIQLFNGNNLLQLKPSNFKPADNDLISQSEQKWSILDNHFCMQNESGFWIFKKP